MNVIDFLRVLRANRLVILGCAALGLAMGIVYSLLQPTLYTATSTAFVTVEGEASISGTETAQTRAQSYIPLINSRTVRERIAAEGLDTAGATMSAALVPNSNLITVSAVAPDAQQAAALANGALVATADVANELDPTSNVKVTAMEDALAPAAPSSPDRVRHLLYGLGAGLVLGLIVAFLRRLLDVNVRTTTDAQVAGGAGLLGAIPLDPSMKAERTAPMAPLSPRASEAVRTIRTRSACPPVWMAHHIWSWSPWVKRPSRSSSHQARTVARSAVEVDSTIVRAVSSFRSSMTPVLMRDQNPFGSVGPSAMTRLMSSRSASEIRRRRLSASKSVKKASSSIHTSQS
ncbi:MAG: hypothetical protein DI545_04370 [Micrococcus luteus]|nr:MAG: hypothetical protein DI545_04370 [Micrococcus luteus]